MQEYATQILLIYRVRKTHLFRATLKLAWKRANVMKKVYQGIQCNAFKNLEILWANQTRRYKEPFCALIRNVFVTQQKKKHAWSRVSETVLCRQELLITRINNNDDDDDDDDNDDDDNDEDNDDDDDDDDNGDDDDDDDDDDNR